MSACLAQLQKVDQPTTVRDVDDVDLELLINQEMDTGNVGSSRSSLSGTGGNQTLNGSSESIGSIEEQHSSGKTNFFGKQFLKSLPVAILAKRKIFGSNLELALSSSSSPTLSLSSSVQSSHTSDSLPIAQLDRSSTVVIERKGVKKMIWSVYITDSKRFQEVELPNSSTCALLLHKLLTNMQQCPDLMKWSILEQNSCGMIERFVEDYEIIDDVSNNQDGDQISRICLNRTPAKYSILQHPEHCLPADMLVFPRNFEPLANAPSNVKRLQMQHILTKTAPELCGWLQVREPGKKSWKKMFCVLRNSGLYYSSKGTSKEPHHLVCVAEVHSARVWFPVSNKKQSGFPTSSSFCLKPYSYNQGSATRWFCAETNQARMAWINGLRLTMNGSRFYESYLSARRSTSNTLVRSSSDRSINKYDGNFVAMDFSGSTGRVIEDPFEADMVEAERGSTWRRRLFNRNLNSNNVLERGVPGHSAPTKDAAFITTSIHLSQPWFYSRISREVASDEIQRHGSLDGTFLVRDSLSIPGGTVVTICHNSKPRHIPISLLEKDGLPCYTIDNGETKFLDLIQFVDFHRLNKGNLPCPLLYPCSRHYS